MTAGTATSADLSSMSDVDLDGLLDEYAAHVQQSPAQAIIELGAVCDEAARRGSGELAGHSSYLLARGHVNLGHLDDALEAIDAARQHFIGAGQPLEALRTGLGRMHVLGDLGRHRDTVDLGEEMLRELDALTASGVASEDLERLFAAAYENIGVGHGSLGHHAEALASYEQAHRRYARAGLDVDAARCDANRGVELVETGQPAAAIAVLRRAGSSFVDDGDDLYAGLCAAYEASAHVQCGDFMAAQRLLGESAEFLIDAEDSTEYARSQRVRAETLVALNLVTEALDLYEHLEVRFADSGLVHDGSVATFGRANVLLAIGRPHDALELFERAEHSFEAIGDEPMQALCRLGRSSVGDSADREALAASAADAFGRLGRRRDEVIARLRLGELAPSRAADQLERCAEILVENPLPDLQWRLLRAHAAVRSAAGDRNGAIALLEQSGAVIERIRDTVTDEHSLVPFMGSRRDVHEDLVRTLIDDGQIDRAFAATTAARSRTLIERTVAPTGAHRERSDDAGPEAGLAIGVRIVYEMIGDELIAFVETPDEVAVVRGLTDRTALERLVQRLAAQWRRFGSASSSLDDTVVLASTLDVLRQLYDVLIAPLPSLSSAPCVVVVPVGSMANIPFAALYDGSRHLIEHTTVSVAASVDGGRRSTRPGRSYLLVGAADEAAPLVCEEIEAIAALEHVEASLVAIGDEAMAAVLLDGAADHDVIHIACHGLHRIDSPALSTLQLGDRSVTALEMAQLDLDGQLVVLSACSSGRQRGVGNIDELMGLPRALLAAGASNVIVNLWPVDDRAATELMTDFHRRLHHSGPVTALRDAQLEMVAAGRHPYYWAPTVAYASEHFEHHTLEHTTLETTDSEETP